jgi:hypothetical protein
VRVLLYQAVVPLVFFLLVSGRSREMLLHWPLFGFLPLYPLVGAAWARWRDAKPRQFHFYLTSWTMTLFVLAAFVVLQARTGLVSFPKTMKDPMIDLSGWRSIADEFEERGYTAEPGVLFATNVWYDSGQLAFALRQPLQARCYHSYDARGFAFWSNPPDDVGSTVYLLFAEQTSEVSIVNEYRSYFTNFTRLADLPMSRAGKPFRTWKVYRGVGMLRPYLFANHRP